MNTDSSVKLSSIETGPEWERTVSHSVTHQRITYRIQILTNSDTGDQRLYIRRTSFGLPVLIRGEVLPWTSTFGLGNRVQTGIGTLLASAKRLFDAVALPEALRGELLDKILEQPVVVARCVA